MSKEKWVGPSDGIMMLIGDEIPDVLVQTSHQIGFSRLQMPIIAVYKDQKDYPGYYVARVFDVNRTTNIIMAKKDFLELQRDIGKHTGMIWLHRTPQDDPALMGTWI